MIVECEKVEEEEGVDDGGEGSSEMRSESGR